MFGIHNIEEREGLKSYMEVDQVMIVEDHTAEFNSN